MCTRICTPAGPCTPRHRRSAQRRSAQACAHNWMDHPAHGSGAAPRSTSSAAHDPISAVDGAVSAVGGAGSANPDGAVEYRGSRWDCGMCAREFCGVKKRVAHSGVGTCRIRIKQTSSQRDAELSSRAVAPVQLPMSPIGLSASGPRWRDVGTFDASTHSLPSSSRDVSTRDASTQSLSSSSSSCMTCGNCMMVQRLVSSSGEEFQGVASLLAESGCINEFHCGWAPLHWSACSGRSDEILILLRLGADVALQAGSGRACETALHIAARKGYRNTCAVLIAAGAPLEQYDGSGLLPLHVVALTEVLVADEDFEGALPSS